MEWVVFYILAMMVIDIAILFYICMRQQKRIEWHKHRIDSLQLKVQDLYYKKRDD